LVTVFEHLEMWRGDLAHAAWLDELPSLVKACAEGWGLDLGPPWTNSRASLTMPADRDGERLVLKLQVPDREGEHEADALRRWDGDGAVPLIDHDPERHALILERLEPGTPLSSIDPEAALTAMIDLVRRLSVPAGPPFRPLADEAADLRAELLAHAERTGRAVPERVITAALEAFDDLVPTQGSSVLVNQDLHADNVLAATREPWFVIDPKPLTGEREFAVVAIVRGPELGHGRDQVRRRLGRVSQELELDRERVRRWTLAHTVAWGFDPEPLPRHMEVATWLRPVGGLGGTDRHLAGRWGSWTPRSPVTS
jgi:streptomycin 6-kinase